MSSIIDLTPQQLRRAANLKEKMAALETELSRILGAPAQAQHDKAPRKKGKMSAAGRANIVAAQKARWAKIKGKTPSVKPVKKTKGKISAAGRKRLAQLAKARWAKIKAAGKKTLAA
jgi:Mn-dependent DtxR family transcriptional regulator